MSARLQRDLSRSLEGSLLIIYAAKDSDEEFGVYVKGEGEGFLVFLHQRRDKNTQDGCQASWFTQMIEYILKHRRQVLK